MARAIYRCVLPRHLRGQLDLFYWLRQRLQPTELVASERKAHIVVLAPHPDDDVLACGGILHKCHLLGHKLTSVYLTDGRKGNPQYPEDKLVAIRQEEAKRAAKVIGIDRLVFLKHGDHTLSASRGTIKEIVELLRELKPTMVFAPFPLDNHPDHLATGRIALQALKEAPPRFYSGYGLWALLPTFNAVEDITPHERCKVEAINEHRSQVELTDLAGAAEGLAKYYSVLTGGNGYAEVFVTCTSKEATRLGNVVM